MIPLLYANNADIKYPLSDFHETDIPNDILLDLSISVPAGIDPILGALRVGPSTVFLSIEDRRTRDPVASVLVTYPVAAHVYPLDMAAVGFGWVIFGSRVTTGEPYFSGDVTVDLDPEVFVALQKTAPRMGLTVNGFPQDITNVLTLLAGSELVTVTAENSTIYIDRNDDVMTEEDILALNAESSEDAFAETRMLFTVAGTEPDDAGNIDITVSGCAQDCGDVRALLLPNGNLALAEDGELPLDIFTPRIFKVGDTCAPEDGLFENSSEAVDAFTGCTDIFAIDIVDTAQNKAIGTLYTVSSAEAELVESVESESSAEAESADSQPADDENGNGSGYGPGNWDGEWEACLDGSSSSGSSEPGFCFPALSCEHKDVYGEILPCTLPKEFVVTLGGLEGTDFAWANGSSRLIGYETQYDFCIWFSEGMKYPAGFYVDYFSLQWVSFVGAWQFKVHSIDESGTFPNNISGSLSWRTGPSDPCDPTGNWGLHDTCHFSNDCNGLVTTCNISGPPGF
jgi:hypothetical protein